MTFRAYMKTLVPALLAGLTLCSCAWKEAEQNRTNLAKLKPGMTQTEVKAVMGEPLNEVYATPDIWYYYTQYKWMDGMNTRDECTPLLFSKDGILLGIGYEFMKDELDKSPEGRRKLDIQL